MGMHHGEIKHFSCFFVYKIFDTIDTKQGLGDFRAQFYFHCTLGDNQEGQLPYHEFETQ
jgi:hypothetical protein